MIFFYIFMGLCLLILLGLFISSIVSCFLPEWKRNGYDHDPWENM